MAGFVGLSGFWQSATCTAHEVRPSYLELREDRAGEFDVPLKTSMRGDFRLALAATFSGRVEAVTPMTREPRAMQRYKPGASGRLNRCVARLFRSTASKTP
jgi:hypothetical protein